MDPIKFIKAIMTNNIFFSFDFCASNGPALTGKFDGKNKYNIVFS